MQSLLLERATGKISALEFATTTTESLYSSLRKLDPGPFPQNCHKNAAVNSLSIELNDHRYLLSGCADSSIKLWDLQPDEEEAEHKTPKEETIKRKPSTEQPLRKPFVAIATVPRKSVHDFGVSAVAWWPQDTGLFISASFDHTVKVWDTNSMAVAHSFDLGSRVYAVDISSSSTNAYSAQALVAVASDQPFVRLLDLRSASSAHTLPGHKGKTLSVAWHPQNPSILALGGFDGEAKIWDIRRSSSCVCRLDMAKTNARDARTDASNLLANVKAHLGPVNAVLWDELGHLLYTAGNDDKVRVWDMQATRAPPINRLVNFGPLTRNKYLQTLPLVLSPRNETEVQHLFFASDSGDVLVLRALDGKLVSKLQRGSSARTVSIVHAGPFSATYYCGTMDGEIVAWSGQRKPAEYVLVGRPKTDYERITDGGMVFGKLEKNAGELKKLYDDPYFRNQE